MGSLYILCLLVRHKELKESSKFLVLVSKDQQGIEYPMRTKQGALKIVTS